MPNINTKNYRVFLAQQFANSVANTETSRLYVGIGRVTSWPDDTPPAPTQDLQSVAYGCWRDSIGFKRVANTDIALVVPRINWTYGTTYAKYDDQDVSLYGKQFFVLDTSGATYRVYKCLWNGTSLTAPLGSTSTVAPSVYAGEGAFPVQSPDDYVWQYLYSIDPADPFLTSDWMPVYADSYIQSVANTFVGTIPTQVPLVIESSGANYSASVNTAFTITGDGVGATMTNTSITIEQNGTLSRAYLTNGGSNYTKIDSIVVYQPFATTAAIRAIVPPTPNHGADPIHELGASAVMLRTRFQQTENGNLTGSNDFRRIFLVQDPLLANGAVATNAFYKQTFDLTVTSISGTFAPDMEVKITNTTYEVTATVVDQITDGPNTILRLTNVAPNGRAFADAFIVNDTIVSQTTPTTNAVVSSVSTPELKPYLGQVLYVENHSAVTRSATSEEEIKLVFNFG